MKHWAKIWWVIFRNGKIVFALNVANTQERMTMYSSEMDYVFTQIQDEIRKTGLSKITVSVVGEGHIVICT